MLGNARHIPVKGQSRSRAARVRDAHTAGSGNRSRTTRLHAVPAAVLVGKVPLKVLVARVWGHLQLGNEGGAHIWVHAGDLCSRGGTGLEAPLRVMPKGKEDATGQGASFGNSM